MGCGVALTVGYPLREPLAQLREMLLQATQPQVARDLPDITLPGGQADDLQLARREREWFPGARRRAKPGEQLSGGGGGDARDQQASLGTLARRASSSAPPSLPCAKSVEDDEEVSLPEARRDLIEERLFATGVQPERGGDRKTQESVPEGKTQLFFTGLAAKVLRSGECGPFAPPDHRRSPCGPPIDTEAFLCYKARTYVKELRSRSSRRGGPCSRQDLEEVTRHEESRIEEILVALVALALTALSLAAVAYAANVPGNLSGGGDFTTSFGVGRITMNGGGIDRRSDRRVLQPEQRQVGQLRRRHRHIQRQVRRRHDLQLHRHLCPLLELPQLQLATTSTRTSSPPATRT